MKSWHHFHLTVTQNCQNLTQLQRCYSVRVHSYDCIPYWKVKKHFIYVQSLGGKQLNVVISLIHDIMASLPPNSHPELPKSDPSPVYCINSVRVHLSAYVPYWKVPNHFIYVQCGCGEQSTVDYSLNHDIMASFPLDSHPEWPKSDPALAV